jgi:uncharacterized membrane protein YvbJ
LTYCRICGAQTEENARFCHKCGTPVVIFTPEPPPPARPVQKNRISLEVIALVAIVAVAVIVSIFVFSLFYSVNFNQANYSNQTNVNKLSFNFQGDMTNVNVITQNLMGKTILTTTSAKGLQYTNSQPLQHKN